MERIETAICDLLDQGETVVLATIVSQSGSTPRTAGSRMLITKDGRGIGTIGGGVLEAGVMTRAVVLIGQGRSAVVPFDLNHNNVADMDMICGGQAEVLLDCIQPHRENRELFTAWRQMVEEERSGWLLSIVNRSQERIERVDHCLFTKTGEVVGACPLERQTQQRVLAAASGMEPMTTVVLDSGFAVVEQVTPLCRAFLFGAGHVALATGALADSVDFAVVVADDREAFANRQRFPNAAQIRVLESFEQALDGITAGPRDYLIILTRGHLHDKTVLAQALGTGAGYIGMIGSRRKRDAIYRALLEEGFAQADLDRVHSPIGISIDAETPEEIAVSIVAEMIAHRAARSE